MATSKNGSENLAHRIVWYAMTLAVGGVIAFGTLVVNDARRDIELCKTNITVLSHELKNVREEQIKRTSRISDLEMKVDQLLARVSKLEKRRLPSLEGSVYGE
jgi:uncharacterized protein YlxW (UPF0749 family)